MRAPTPRRHLPFVRHVINSAEPLDLDDGFLLIRERKFHKSRIVPLQPDVTRTLARYADAPRSIDTAPILMWRSLSMDGVGRVATRASSRPFWILRAVSAFVPRPVSAGHVFTICATMPHPA
jgi:hypothetical protein